MLLKAVLRYYIWYLGQSVIHLQCVFHSIRFKVNKDWLLVMGGPFF